VCIICDIFLDPPTVTAPKLKCVEGCCLLPIITVTTNNNDLYLVCNVSNPHDTIVWYNGDTVAKGTNNEEVILLVVVRMTFYYFTALQIPLLQRQGWYHYPSDLCCFQSLWQHNPYL